MFKGCFRKKNNGFPGRLAKIVATIFSFLGVGKFYFISPLSLQIYASRYSIYQAISIDSLSCFPWKYRYKTRFEINCWNILIHNRFMRLSTCTNELKVWYKDKVFCLKVQVGTTKIFLARVSNLIKNQSMVRTWSYCWSYIYISWRSNKHVLSISVCM